MQDYNVVIPQKYSASEWLFAHELAQLFEANGKTASVSSLGTGIGETLFVGNSEKLTGNKYSVRNRRISAGSVYAFEALIEKLEPLINKGTAFGDVTLSGDVTDSLSDSRVYTQKRMGDVRVMYFNVFNNIYKPDKINTPNLSSGPIPLRHLMEKELIEAYSPDVLCMQEYQQWFREGWEGSPTMTSYLNELGLTEVVADMPSGASNATPIFYNAKRVTLVRCGYLPYTDNGGDLTKTLTWARFRVNGNGKEFVAISTHFMWNADWLTKDEWSAIRGSNAREALALISEVGSDVPVIFGGDLNCNTASDEWKLLHASMSYAKDVAEVKNTSGGWKPYATYDSDTNTYIDIPVPQDGNGLDHVFVKGGMKVNAFMTVTDKFALCSSDHCPKFVDITLN